MPVAKKVVENVDVTDVASEVKESGEGPDKVLLEPKTHREVFKELRRPFAPESVKFRADGKVQGDAAVGQVRCLSYIDSRLVSDRLNDVCGGDWHDEYKVLIGSNGQILGVECALTVMGVTRTDVGEPGEALAAKRPKAIYSDSLKRAAVKFGIGCFLYALPVLRGESSSKGYLTDTGKKQLRDGYTRWLNSPETVKYWGTPFIYGDAEDAQGDAEVDSSEEEQHARPGSEDLQAVSDVVAHSHPEPTLFSREESTLPIVKPSVEQLPSNSSANLPGEIFEILKDKERIPKTVRIATFVMMGIPADANKEYILTMPVTEQEQLLQALKGIKSYSKAPVSVS